MTLLYFLLWHPILDVDKLFGFVDIYLSFVDCLLDSLTRTYTNVEDFLKSQSLFLPVVIKSQWVYIIEPDIYCF